MCIRDRDEADNERVDSSATLTVAVVAPADTTDPADSGSNLSLIHISEPTRPY